jgi:hypothetical protein
MIFKNIKKIAFSTQAETKKTSLFLNYLKQKDNL